jgi:hypothetical protein
MRHGIKESNKEAFQIIKKVKNKSNIVKFQQKQIILVFPGPFEAECGWMWLDVAGCGWVWLGVAGCGWVWLGVGGCGWMWVDVGGCGWIRYIVTTVQDTYTYTQTHMHTTKRYT